MTSSRAGATKPRSPTARTLLHLFEKYKHGREDRLVVLQEHVRRLEAIDAQVHRRRLVPVPDAVVDRLHQPKTRIVDDPSDLVRREHFAPRDAAHAPLRRERQNAAWCE